MSLPYEKQQFQVPEAIKQVNTLNATCIKQNLDEKSDQFNHH